MTPASLERFIRERLDGTFTRIGGVQEAVPLSFIPSHNPPYRHGTGEHLKWLHIRTTDVLSAFWPLVEATALELIEKKEIQGKDVAALIPRAIEIKAAKRMAEA